MNADQATRLQYLNDNYGVATWDDSGETVIVTLDDGDRAEIHPDGTATFESASGETAHKPDTQSGEI